MDNTSLLHADYLDIIFDQRNKKYGGYELRKHYSQRVGRALLVLVAGVGALTGLSFITAGNTATTQPKPVLIVCDLKKFDKPPVLPLKIKTPEAPPAAPAKTFIHTPPVITNEPIKEAPQMQDPKPPTDAQPGPSNNDAEGVGHATGIKGGTGVVIPATEVVKKEPAIWVEQMPKYNGDMAEYLNRNLRYPDFARENNISGLVLVRFVVNEDGAVSEATIVRGIGGGCDEEALRIVRGMPKWKPGKQNGVPVKVYFTLPIHFQLN